MPIPKFGETDREENNLDKISQPSQSLDRQDVKKDNAQGGGKPAGYSSDLEQGRAVRNARDDEFEQ